MVLLETVPVIAPVPLQSMMPSPPEESLLPRLVELVTVFPSMVNVEPAFTYKFIPWLALLSRMLLVILTVWLSPLLMWMPPSALWRMVQLSMKGETELTPRIA